MKRALIYASVASMIQQFNMNNIRLLIDLGYHVDVACNMESGSTISDDAIESMKKQLSSQAVSVHHIPVPRKISKIKEIIKSFVLTKELIKNNKYDVIHCQSPIGGIVCRLANKAAKCSGKNKMIYTAHGFHFYKGAPIKNWLLFYPLEKMSSYFTDVLITINKEDYELAKKKMRAKEVAYIPGVGVDVKRFAECEIDKKKKREEIGIPEDAILLVSVGELNSNKNQKVIVEALFNLKNDNVYYIIVGKGCNEKALKKLAENYGIKKNVYFLGYRTDVNELYKMADVFCFPSYREGLGLAALEAMAAGLPLITSNVRGINEYSEDEVTGYKCDPNDVKGFEKAISILAKSEEKRREFGKINRERVQKYDIYNIESLMKRCYEGE